MRWTPSGGGWWNDDVGAESEFEIAELRVLAPNKPMPPEAPEEHVREER